MTPEAAPRTAAQRLYRAYWDARWTAYRQAQPLQWEQLAERERQCWDAVAIMAAFHEHQWASGRVTSHAHENDDKGHGHSGSFAIEAEAAAPAEGLREALERLREMSAKATPGPWQPYIAYSGESGTPDEIGLFAGSETNHRTEASGYGTDNTVISDFSLRTENLLPDVEFIAEAVNYVRAALARHESAGSE